VDRLRGMTGKGNVSKASVLRIVTPAELIAGFIWMRSQVSYAV
jgi:hypothetical protein